MRVAALWNFFLTFASRIPTRDFGIATLRRSIVHFFLDFIFH